MLVCYLQMLDTPEEKLRFEQLYVNCRGAMFRAAKRILRSDQDAEDAVHNAFLKILRHFSRYQATPPEELTPLASVIARNEAVSLLRRRRNEAPLEDWDESPEQSAESLADYHALVELFARLPQTYRSALEMKAAGYTDGEIASRLGLSKTAVSTRLSRGRQLLREIVEREGFQMEA